MKNNLLASYLRSLQINGRYTFTTSEALTALQTTPTAFKLAALRLIKRKELSRPKQGFYVIVPTEYQEVGAPPAAWFIDYLMQFNGQPYYVGLLSAAALHGAAHQQPQTFQVITNKSLRSIQVGRSRIQFFTKKNISPTSHESIKTPTGYMQVSTPETTAIDLVYYAKSVGHFNHVVTVLSELRDQLDAERLLNRLETDPIELSCLQRLGYLLETIDAGKNITDLLKQWVKKQKPARALPLRSDKPYKNCIKNDDWQLYINEMLESDL